MSENNSECGGISEKEKDLFFQFISELEADISKLEELKKTYILAQERVEGGANDTRDSIALVYAIQDIYYCLKEYFLRVRRFFEKNEDPEQWYIDTLEECTTHVMELLCALLSVSLVEEFDELSFIRESFRNLFQFKVDPDNVEWLKEELPKALDIFIDDQKQSISHLRELLAVFVKGGKNREIDPTSLSVPVWLALYSVSKNLH
jgi:hypothetical protein